MPRGVRNPKPEETITEVQTGEAKVDELVQTEESATLGDEQGAAIPNEVQPDSLTDGSDEPKPDEVAVEGAEPGDVEPGAAVVAETPVDSDAVVDEGGPEPEGSELIEGGSDEIIVEQDGDVEPNQTLTSEIKVDASAEGTPLPTVQPPAADTIVPSEPLIPDDGANGAAADAQVDSTVPEDKLEEVQDGEYNVGDELSARMSTVRVFESSVSSSYKRMQLPLFVFDMLVQHDRIKVTTSIGGAYAGWVNLGDVKVVEEVEPAE